MGEKRTKDNTGWWVAGITVAFLVVLQFVLIVRLATLYHMRQASEAKKPSAPVSGDGGEPPALEETPLPFPPPETIVENTPAPPLPAEGGALADTESNEHPVPQKNAPSPPRRQARQSGSTTITARPEEPALGKTVQQPPVIPSNRKEADRPRLLHVPRAYTVRIPEMFIVVQHEELYILTDPGHGVFFRTFRRPGRLIHDKEFLPELYGDFTLRKVSAFEQDGIEGHRYDYIDENNPDQGLILLATYHNDPPPTVPLLEPKKKRGPETVIFLGHWRVGSGRKRILQIIETIAPLSEKAVGHTAAEWHLIQNDMLSRE